MTNTYFDGSDEDKSTICDLVTIELVEGKPTTKIFRKIPTRIMISN